MDGRRRMAGPGWEGGQHHDVKRKKRETNVRNSLCHATIEHGLRQLAAARGEKSERRNAEGRMLAVEQLMGNSVDCATHTAWDSDLDSDLGENIEMIGEREIMINVLPSLLPEMSRAGRAGRAKKMFP